MLSDAVPLSPPLWSLFSPPFTSTQLGVSNVTNFTQRGPTPAAIVEDRNATTPKKVRHQ
jgi:hypothetical protein